MDARVPPRRALELFYEKENPAWAQRSCSTTIDFDNIHYFVRATDRDERSWDDVPEYIRNTFDKLGIPEAEKKFLAGVGAQYDSEVVYHNIREDLEKLGVIFLGTDQALAEHRRHLQGVLRDGRPVRRQPLRRAQQRGLVAVARSSTCRRA